MLISGFLIPQLVARTHTNPKIVNSVIIHKQIEAVLTLPKQPNFETDVLVPLRKSQAERAAADAAAAQEAARVAAQEAAQAIVAPQAPIITTPAPNNAQCYAWMAQAGIVDTGNAYNVFMFESGCNPNAVNHNGGACGIGQQLPCGKWAHLWSDPVGGMIDAQAYVFARYGSWANAWATEQNQGSY